MIRLSQKTTWSNFIRFSVHASCLPVAVAWSFSDGKAIGYLLSVLWMTSCFHVIREIGQNQGQRVCFLQFPRWRHRGRSLPFSTASCFAMWNCVSVHKLSSICFAVSATSIGLNGEAILVWLGCLSALAQLRRSRAITSGRTLSLSRVVCCILPRVIGQFYACSSVLWQVKIISLCLEEHKQTWKWWRNDPVLSRLSCLLIVCSLGIAIPPASLCFTDVTFFF